MFVEEITTVRHLEKSGLNSLAHIVQQAVISLLLQEFPEINNTELYEKSESRPVLLGTINQVWKEPVWDWETGKLISANAGGNWSLHNNFNIPVNSTAK